MRHHYKLRLIFIYQVWWFKQLTLFSDANSNTATHLRSTFKHYLPHLLYLRRNLRRLYRLWTSLYSGRRRYFLMLLRLLVSVLFKFIIKFLNLIRICYLSMFNNSCNIFHIKHLLHSSSRVSIILSYKCIECDSNIFSDLGLYLLFGLLNGLLSFIRCNGFPVRVWL